MSTASIDGYLSEGETAARLGVTRSTLRTWAARRRGPPRTVVGRTIFFREEALKGWLLSRERDPEAARKAQADTRGRSRAR